MMSGRLQILTSNAIEPGDKTGRFGRRGVNDRSSFVARDRRLAHIYPPALWSWQVQRLRARDVVTGTVESWLQRETAERAAADVPGIRVVDNRITIAAHEGGEGVDEIC
jgi:hypothetical protein